MDAIHGAMHGMVSLQATQAGIEADLTLHRPCCVVACQGCHPMPIILCSLSTEVRMQVAGEPASTELA